MIQAREYSVFEGPVCHNESTMCRVFFGALQPANSIFFFFINVGQRRRGVFLSQNLRGVKKIRAVKFSVF